MFDKYSLKVCKIFKGAEKEMQMLKHPYVGTEHLLLALLKYSDEVSFIAKKYGLTYELFKKELINVLGNVNEEKECILYTPLLKRVINTAVEDAKVGQNEVNDKYLFRAIFDEGEGIAIRLIISMGINIDKLYDDIIISDNKKINTKLDILNIGINLNEEVELDEKCVGREKELDLIIETLIRKNKNNPLLVGDAGVGKTAIIEELVRRIKKGEVPKVLEDKRIINLELGSLVAGTKYRGEFEEKLTKIIKELENNKDIIVFIDEIHSIVNAGGAEGAINASDILKPYLARGKIKVIGATTTEEYNKYIIKDKALARRFECIKVLEPNEEETINILKKVKKSYEKHYGIKISNENIIDIVSLANRFIGERKNPDKSLDILDSVCAMVSIKDDCRKDKKKIMQSIKKLNEQKEYYVKINDFSKAIDIQERIILLNSKMEISKNSTIINKNDILNLISKKCNVPLLANKKLIISKLKKYLNSNIIGQEQAIDKIIDNIKNRNENKPLCLLFTGTTGVGKTKTATLISKSMNMNMIRLDMSEYNLDISVNRLIGASAGFVGYDDGAIFNKIKMNPYSVILVDELEKASPAVINLFLQIMDEGFITNSQGEKLDFKNTIIIMTSNIIGSKRIGFNESKIDFKDNFSKEFLSRFDDIILFTKINRDIVKNYLRRNNIDDLSIINNIDYEQYGLREVEKVVDKFKRTINS